MEFGVRSYGLYYLGTKKFVGDLKNGNGLT